MTDFIITAPNGKKYKVSGPKGSTKEDALRQVQQKLGAAPAAEVKQPVAETSPPVSGAGLAKAAGAGVAEGVIGLPGAIGDVSQLNQSLLSRGAEAIGLPEWAQQGAAMGGKMLMGPFGNMPNTSQITQAVEGITGPLYKPQNVGEEYARTAGQFAPAALLGPGRLASKVATAGASSLLSETAGQTARKIAPEVEPYARLGGALLGGVRMGGKKASVAPTAEDWRAKKNALYSEAEQGPGKVKMTRTHVERLARGFNEVGKDTNKGGVLSSMTDDLYKGTNQTISKFNKVATDVVTGKVPPPTFGELESLRQNLNAAVRQNIGPTGKPTADGTMSARLVEQIDDLLINSPFKKAGAAYRTTLKAEKIQDAFRAAELNAGSNYTQAGMEKAIQGQFKRIALDKNFKRLFTPEEQAAIEGVVKTRGVHNLMKKFGRLAPTGALSTMFNIVTTTSMPWLGIPLGAGAAAAKYGSTAKTLGKAAQVDEMVRMGGAPIPKRNLIGSDSVRRLGLLGSASQAGDR